MSRFVGRCAETEHSAGSLDRGRGRQLTAILEVTSPIGRSYAYAYGLAVSDRSIRWTSESHAAVRLQPVRAWPYCLLLSFRVLPKRFSLRSHGRLKPATAPRTSTPSAFENTRWRSPGMRASTIPCFSTRFKRQRCSTTSGSSAIADRLLDKPGPLTFDEYDQVKQHATIGAEILSGVPFPGPLALLVRHHHENWDGTGYPDALRRDAIPLGARVLSIADCYDALTSDRPYRRALSHDAAIAHDPRATRHDVRPGR